MSIKTRKWHSAWLILGANLLSGVFVCDQARKNTVIILIFESIRLNSQYHLLYMVLVFYLFIHCYFIHPLHHLYMIIIDTHLFVIQYVQPTLIL